MFSKLKNYRNIKPARVSTNRDSYLSCIKRLSIRIQKIKDIEEQVPNKLIKLENNKFKDFVCGFLG